MTKSTEGEWTEPVTTKTSAPQASEPANEREIQKSKWSIPNKKMTSKQKKVRLFFNIHIKKFLYLYIIYLYKNIFQKKSLGLNSIFSTRKSQMIFLNGQKMNKLKYFGIYFGIIDF